MAKLDPSRTALELTDEELAAVGALMTGTAEPPRALVEELERAGVVDGGRLEGYAARMMEVIGDPELRLMIERLAGGPLQYGPFAAVRDEFGVWAETTREGTTEFTPIEPSLVPWAVASAVGLGPRAEPTSRGRSSSGLPRLQLALDRLAELDSSPQCGSSSWPPTSTSSSAKLLCALLLQRRLSWRAFSTSGGLAGRPRSPSSTAARAGFWFSEHLDPESAIRSSAQPTTAGAVWERIVALAPVPVPAHG